MFFERYDKGITEPFAISVISKSFDSKYAEYSQPEDTDDFDFVSPDGKRAVEVVYVIPPNEMNAYKYEKAFSKENSSESKKKATKEKVKQAKFDEYGNIRCYYGGSLQEIIKGIKNTVATKNEKAKKRKNFEKYESVDLCIGVQDGSLMDIQSYRNAGFNFDEFIFDNIFFITPSYFFRYSTSTGFEEYTRQR